MFACECVLVCGEREKFVCVCVCARTVVCAVKVYKRWVPPDLNFECCRCLHACLRVHVCVCQSVTVCVCVYVSHVWVSVCVVVWSRHMQHQCFSLAAASEANGVAGDAMALIRACQAFAACIAKDWERDAINKSASVRNLQFLVKAEIP